MHDQAHFSKTGPHVCPQASAGAATATATWSCCLLQRVVVQLLVSPPAWQLPWRQRTLEWRQESSNRLRQDTPAQQVLRPPQLARLVVAQRSRQHLVLQLRGRTLMVVVQPCRQHQVLLAHLGAASKQQPPPLPRLPPMRC